MYTHWEGIKLSLFIGDMTVYVKNTKESTKINSKWNIDVYVKHKSTELLQDTTGENLDASGLAMSF